MNTSEKDLIIGEKGFAATFLKSELTNIIKSLDLLVNKNLKNT